MFGRKLAYQAAKAAYVKDAAPLPGGWFPVVSTDTLKAWRGVGNQLLIALRGTADMRDVRADAGLPFGQLEKSNRYAVDFAVMESLARKYPPSRWTWHLTGHSLGGALAAAFKRRYPWIRDGVVFNAANAPIDVLPQPENLHYVYAAHGPLYLSTGHFMRDSKVVPSQAPPQTDALAKLVEFWRGTCRSVERCR